jgi:hypothetical protein
MSTTLVTLGGTLTLPSDLVWKDEAKWTPVATAKSVTLGGSLIVEKSAQAFGRPITLGNQADGAWLTSNEVDALRAAEAAQGDTPMTLTLNDGRSFAVLFDGTAGAPGVEAEQVYWRVAADLTERNLLQWWLTLRFIQVG